MMSHKFLCSSFWSPISFVSMGGMGNKEPFKVTKSAFMDDSRHPLSQVLLLFAILSFSYENNSISKLSNVNVELSTLQLATGTRDSTRERLTVEGTWKRQGKINS